MTAGPVDWLHRTTPVGFLFTAAALLIALGVFTLVAWNAYHERRRRPGSYASDDEINRYLGLKYPKSRRNP